MFHLYLDILNNLSILYKHFIAMIFIVFVRFILLEGKWYIAVLLFVHFS